MTQNENNWVFWREKCIRKFLVLFLQVFCIWNNRKIKKVIYTIKLYPKAIATLLGWRTHIITHKKIKIWSFWNQIWENYIGWFSLSGGIGTAFMNVIDKSWKWISFSPEDNRTSPVPRQLICFTLAIVATENEKLVLPLGPIPSLDPLHRLTTRRACECVYILPTGNGVETPICLTCLPETGLRR
jgi:hypothetical protein